MVPYILAVLALFFVQTLLPVAIRYAGAKTGIGATLVAALGNRDDLPSIGAVGQRAQRALANMHEALPVFLTLALLLEFQGVAEGVAVTGAMVFVVARVVYVPVYMAGVFGLRSALWTAGHVGLGLMVCGLVCGA